MPAGGAMHRIAGTTGNAAGLQVVHAETRIPRRKMRIVGRLKCRAMHLAARLLVAASFFVLGCEQSSDTDGPVVSRIDTQATQDFTNDLDVEIDGQPAPYFTLPTLDGDTLTMADLEGQVIVLNFWATWCAPCRVEIPDLIEMQTELEDEGVQFVGISIDDLGIEAVRAYAKEARFNYPILLGDGEIANAYGGVYALPTTILVDREGMVKRKITGLVSKSMLMPILQEMASV